MAARKKPKDEPGLLMRRTLGGLEAEDEHTLAQLRAVKVGETVEIALCLKRDLRNLRRWWGLCRMLAYHTDKFPSPNAAHGALKVGAGHFIPVVSAKSGEVYKIPDSIAFDRLEETEFQAVWQRAVQFVCEEILPGVTEAEVEHEVLRLIGGAV